MYEQKIIEFLRKNGPSLPNEIKSAINADLILTGAILSDLVHKKVILITKGKIGGSNLYYLPGQEKDLSRLYDYLKEPEKAIFDKLKENLVLGDEILSPVEQVAIRQIPDFAKPFEFEQKLFWRWHLIDEEMAKKILLEKKNSKEQQNEEQEKKETNAEGLREKQEVATNQYSQGEIPKEEREKEEKENDKMNNRSLNEDYKRENKEEIKEKTSQKAFFFSNVNSENLEKLKIANKKDFAQWLNNNGLKIKKVLLNAKGFTIVLASKDFINIAVGFHEKKRVTENDLLLFYGYAQFAQVLGVLICKYNLNSNAQSIAKQLPIKIYSLKRNDFLR